MRKTTSSYVPPKKCLRFVSSENELARRTALRTRGRWSLKFELVNTFASLKSLQKPNEERDSAQLRWGAVGHQVYDPYPKSFWNES